MTDEQNEKPTTTPEQGEQGQRSRLSELLAASLDRTNILLAEHDAGERKEMERQVALDRGLRKLIGDQELLRFMKARGIDKIDLVNNFSEGQGGRSEQFSLGADGSLIYKVGVAKRPNKVFPFKLIDINDIHVPSARISEELHRNFAPDGKMLASDVEYQDYNELLPNFYRNGNILGDVTAEDIEANVVKFVSAR